jgi:hypothetical protein
MHFSPQRMGLARVGIGAVEKTQLNPMMFLQMIDSRLPARRSLDDRAAV